MVNGCNLCDGHVRDCDGGVQGRREAATVVLTYPFVALAGAHGPGRGLLRSAGGECGKRQSPDAAVDMVSRGGRGEEEDGRAAKGADVMIEGRPESSQAAAGEREGGVAQ